MKPEVKKLFIERWETKLNREIPTYSLQVESLRDFLKELNYEFSRNDVDGTWHISKVAWDESENPKFMSLDEAVSLYNPSDNPFRHLRTNGLIVEWKGYTFNRAVYHKAYQDRILERVYLQRKDGEWHVGKNIVKFNKPMTFKRYETVEDTY